MLSRLAPGRRRSPREGSGRSRGARAAVEIMTTARFNPNTVDSIMALPSALRAPLWSEILDREKLLAWFQQYEPPALDLPDIESPGDVRAFLESSDG